VREFWLIDARGEAIDFRIHRRGPAEFVPVPPDAEGYTPSAVLGKAFRLTRQAGPVANTLVYRLEVKA
jgi:hypothetical protein